MAAPFLPDKQNVTAKSGLMQERWLDWARGTSRSNSVVLTGDETTSDATGDATALAVGGDTLRCNNATLLRLHGIEPDFSSGLGQSIPVVSVGAGLVEIVPESALADASRRIAPVKSFLVRLAPGTGRAWLEYDGTSQRHRVLFHEQGAALTPVFLASDFQASAGLWTVAAPGVQALTYYLRGSSLLVNFAIVSATVSSTPASLSFVIPGGYTSAGVARTLFEASDNGTKTTGSARVSAGGTTVTLARLDAANWAISAGATHVWGSFEFEVSA